LKIGKENYPEYVKKKTKNSPLLADCLRAFLFGGAICTLGELIRQGLIAMDFSAEHVKNWLPIIMIFLGAAFTGFGLYDKSFVDTLRSLGDPTPFIRGIVAELGPERKEIEYEQPQRRAGKTSNNWKTLYDAAMLSFTSYTKIFLRLPAIIGGVLAGLSVLGLLVYAVTSLLRGFAPFAELMLLVICLFAGVQLFFIGMIGEYILVMNERIKNRPLVVEEVRLNFERAEEKELTTV
jgi:hypothetical protein